MASKTSSSCMRALIWGTLFGMDYVIEMDKDSGKPRAYQVEYSD